jgi:flagellin
MRIQGNWLSFMSWRSFSKNTSGLDASLQKLSSGLRINSAADDAAGLAMSENFITRYRSLVQATRNAQDGISLLDTAEGALQEIHNMLNRGRELSLQAANGIYSTEERTSIQVEIDDILREIDRISDTTTFNSRRLFNSFGSGATIGKIINGLQNGWLEKAADIIKQYYGVEGDGSKITIRFENQGPNAAWITGTPGVNGVLDDLELHINLGAFGSSTVAGAATSNLIADDRKIARALTMATLARAVDYYNLPSWFRSGVADLLAGRDETLQADLTKYGANALVAALATPWQEDSIHQSAAYLAVKYLASQLPPGGMKSLMTELSLSGSAADLDTAFSNTLGLDVGTFLAQFASDGATYAGTLLLTDPDVGSIHPGDNETVIPDDGAYSDNPLAPAFDIDWSDNGAMDPVKIALQVGANNSDWVELVLPHMSTLSLGLVGTNVISRATKAIDQFTKAVNKVSDYRAQIGAQSNRLEVTVTVNRGQAEEQISSYSRIRDLDFAKELTTLTRQQILTQSSGAALAQANNMRQNVKWLLNGMSSTRSTGAAFGM